MTSFTLHSISVAGRLTNHHRYAYTPPSLSTFLCQRFLPVTLSSSSPRSRSLPLALLRRRSVASLAASREDSHAEEREAEKEEGDGGSPEEWKQVLESFKEQALKMQTVSQEAYEEYTKRATVLLQETSERLKIQGDKASQDLSVILNEISENSTVYLATAAENTPEPLKELVETYASSTDEVSSFEQLQDFHVGIPYGAGLSVGGFLYFMLTGSVSAIRFGVILGGALLALSIDSLRSWKKGGPSPVAIKGQAAIAGILFLRELRLLFQRGSFSTLFATLISGAMAGTYIYLFALAGKKPNPENGTQN